MPVLDAAQEVRKLLVVQAAVDVHRGTGHEAGDGRTRPHRIGRIAASLTGDDAVRPPFPGEPSELLPFGEATHADHVELIGIRRRHPWLVSANLHVAEVTQEGLAIELSSEKGRLGVALNFSAPDRAAPVGRRGPRRGVRLRGGRVRSTAGRGARTPGAPAAGRPAPATPANRSG